ncbi:MAG: bifunctional oligoribonuclease/PAP phosphatase NrnA [Gilvibacter sp.]
MENSLFTELQQHLATPKKIVVIGHKNPDGDALGSTAALGSFLKKLNHQVTVMVPNDFPDFLKWMPTSESIDVYDKNPKRAELKIKEADFIFTLDFNDLSRVGAMQSAFEGSKATYVMIDHHQAPEDYAKYVYSDASMGSTSEMVYHFIDRLGMLRLIDADMAANLYTGIMTDSGSFRFPATTSTTHRVIADLIDKGAPNTAIHQNVYDTNSPDRLKLLGIALKNLTVLPEYNTAYISLSQSELDSCSFKKGDTEGFVQYALSIKNTRLAVIFIESRKDQIIKISLRSKGDLSVNQMARDYFHGGGHINAAGGKSDKSLDDTITDFISILPHYKTALVDE